MAIRESVTQFRSLGWEKGSNGEAGMAVRGLGLSPSGVTAAWPSQRDDEDGDVIPGTQLVVWETPATVPGDAPGPQDQSLGQSCIPARSTCAHSCTNMYTRRQRYRPICGSPGFTLLCPFLHQHYPSQHLARRPLPAGIIGLIGRQHPVHSGSYLTVIGHIPQAICSQD